MHLPVVGVVVVAVVVVVIVVVIVENALVVLVVVVVDGLASVLRFSSSFFLPPFLPFLAPTR